MKTNRIGIFTVDATAPIAGGEADWSGTTAHLDLQVQIDEVKTGSSLLDPEVRALVKKGSDGLLTFIRSGHVDDDEVRFEGTATSGNIKVPLVLVGSAESDESERDVTITGNATIDNVHIPLPGFSHVRTIEIQVEGLLRLSRK